LERKSCSKAGTESNKLDLVRRLAHLLVRHVGRGSRLGTHFAWTRASHSNPYV